MAETQQHPDTVWQRLRSNREKNTHLFAEAGIRPEATGKVICPSCGAEESAIFWSLTGRSAGRIKLLCPVCEDAQVRYDMAKNRPVDPVFTRGSVGGGLGMVALLVVLFGLFWFRESEPVRMAVEDARDAREAVASRANRATSGVLGEGSYRPPGGGSGTRSTSARPAAGGSTGSGGSGGTRSTGGGGTGGSAAGRTGSGAGSPGVSIPTTQQQRPVAGAPVLAAPREPGTLVYRARGDRREQIDLDAARIIQRRGQAEASLLVAVEYDAQRDETQVMVDAASDEWPRRLGWFRGWRRVEQP
jgi:hypothetical protein